jgi:hypothetical protein
MSDEDFFSLTGIMFRTIRAALDAPIELTPWGAGRMLEASR